MVTVFRHVKAGEPALIVVAVVMSVVNDPFVCCHDCHPRLAILRVIAALLVGVLGFIAMNLERFARTLRQSLLVVLCAFVATVVRQLVASIVVTIVVIVAIVVIFVIARGVVLAAPVPRFIVVLSHAPLRVGLFKVSL